jgi:hypothetical protein
LLAARFGFWAGTWLATVSPLVGLTACVRFESKPLTAAKVAADFDSRTFADAALRVSLQTNRIAREWPRRTW